MEFNKRTNRRAFLGGLTAATIGGIALLQEAYAAQSAGATSLLSGWNKDEKRLVPVMITPFLSSGKIDYNNVSRLVDFYEAAGAKGFFANCLSSEMYQLDSQERLALTSQVVKRVNGRLPVVASGSFGDNLKEKALFTKKISDTGADATILITGHFAEKNESDKKLMENFEQFFNLTGSVKLGTYECPTPYKRVLSAEVYRFLASNPNMVYHKDTSEDIEGIAEKLKISNGTQLKLYNAHTASGLKSLQLGGSGMSPISANFYPEIHSWLCQYANTPSKKADAIWIQEEIARMEPVISSKYPVSAKYFLRKRGLPIELSSRKTKASLQAEDRAVLDETYRVFLGWCERLGIDAVKAS